MANMISTTSMTTTAIFCLFNILLSQQQVSCYNLPSLPSSSSSSSSFRRLRNHLKISPSSLGHVSTNTATTPSSPLTPTTTKPTRRSFFLQFTTFSLLATTPLFHTTTPAIAADNIPSIPSSEFETILKTSANSIKIVTFSGVKNEQCLVTLIDGTSFTINDLIESSVDPRSPLRIVSLCRDFGVPVKFAGLEEALKNVPKKSKVYSNKRVLEAAEKEKAKAERMRVDEEERLRKLYEMQEREAAEEAKAEAKAKGVAGEGL